MGYERIVSRICLVSFLFLLLQPSTLLQATFYGESPRPGLNQYPFKRGGYYVYLPSNYNQEHQYPLIVLSHIYMGEPELEPQELMESWIRLADQRNYIVILPIAGGDPRFTDAWYLDLLRTIRELYAIDQSRILLTGFGAGAHYALHLGASYPDEFRAVSPVAGPIEGYWKQSTRFLKKNRPNFYFLSGAQDHRVPSKEVQQTVKMMDGMGYQVQFETLEGIDHSYSDEFTQKIADWFDKLD